jgi:hypothetical protein
LGNLDVKQDLFNNQNWVVTLSNGFRTFLCKVAPFSFVQQNVTGQTWNLVGDGGFGYCYYYCFYEIFFININLY